MKSGEMIGADTVKIRELPHLDLFRIAIVEDSANIRERLVSLVESTGGMQIVGEADTEERAINICRHTDPDALILDMRLMKGSGLGVLRAMHYTPAQRKPAIIVLTNFPSPAVERAARALGASWFLDKSRQFNQIPDLLRSLLQQRLAST